MKAFSKKTTSVDPIGPGSPAWNHADSAANHFANNQRNAFFCAQRRMIIELRKNNTPAAVIDAWKRDIREFPIEL